METWIALLPGINVGGHHLVRMKDLAGHLEAGGFSRVRSYIQSGNVVLQCQAFRLIGSVLYLYAPDGIGRSKLAEKIGKALPGTDLTARNLNTINKLLEMSA